MAVKDMVIVAPQRDTGMFRVDDLRELARASASSGFFPGIKTPEQALVLMALAQAEGIAPIQAVMRYDVIQGRPAKKAQAMLADFMVAGGKVVWHQHDEESCEATFSHPLGGEIKVKWDVEKARKAELLGNDNWKKYRENMLHARCVSNGVRFVCPAATGGLYTPEEVADFAGDKWQNLPKETRPEQDAAFTQVNEAAKVAPKIEFPPIPDRVTFIPPSLCKGIFKPLGEFDEPIQKLKQADLELIISLVSDNRGKVVNEAAKAWLLAIEAEATAELRNVQLDAMDVPLTTQLDTQDGAQ